MHAHMHVHFMHLLLVCNFLCPWVWSNYRMFVWAIVWAWALWIIPVSCEQDSTPYTHTYTVTITNHHKTYNVSPPLWHFWVVGCGRRGTCGWSSRRGQRWPSGGWMSPGRRRTRTPRWRGGRRRRCPRWTGWSQWACPGCSGSASWTALWSLQVSECMHTVKWDWKVA